MGSAFGAMKCPVANLRMDICKPCQESCRKLIYLQRVMSLLTGSGILPSFLPSWWVTNGFTSRGLSLTARITSTAPESGMQWVCNQGRLPSDIPPLRFGNDGRTDISDIDHVPTEEHPYYSRTTPVLHPVLHPALLAVVPPPPTSSIL